MRRWTGGLTVLLVLGSLSRSSLGAANEESPARGHLGRDPIGTPAAQSHAPTYQDRLFQNFVVRYFKGYFDFRPADASEIGLHDRDGHMPDLSRGALGREANRLRAAYAEINTIDGAQLARDNALDRRLLLSSIQAELLELTEVRSWQRQPAYYNDRVSGPIFTLVKRHFASPEERLRSVIARETQIPAVWQAARTNLDNPPKLWVEVAMDETQGTLDFLKTDVPAALAGVGDAALQAAFVESTRVAVQATTAYVAWLREWLLPRAHGDFRLGDAVFRKKLLFEEMVDAPLEVLLDQGYAELARQQQHFKDTAAQIDPTLGPQQVLSKLAHDHVAPDKLIGETQQLLASLRDFCIDHGILDLPSLDLPVVKETPPFARAFTFASMDTPGAFEQVGREAYFYLTLPEPGWTPAHVEEHMEAYWRGDIANTAIHEAYPGHYAQFLWMPYAPTYTRKVLGANTFIEGWAHYSEEMMLEEGYGNQDPELWLSEEQWALVRVCRYIVGIQLHTRGMSLEEGVAFFEQNAYLTHSNAVREAQRGTADPTYLYYTLGKMQIRALRAETEAREGHHFSLRRFHDRLLSQGFAPLAVVREAMGYAAEADADEFEEAQEREGLPQAPIELRPNVRPTGAERLDQPTVLLPAAPDLPPPSQR